jgi:hypothetical protein
LKVSHNRLKFNDCCIDNLGHQGRSGDQGGKPGLPPGFSVLHGVFPTIPYQKGPRAIGAPDQVGQYSGENFGRLEKAS